MTDTHTSSLDIRPHYCKPVWDFGLQFWGFLFNSILKNIMKNGTKLSLSNNSIPQITYDGKKLFLMNKMMEVKGYNMQISDWLKNEKPLVFLGHLQKQIDSSFDVKNFLIQCGLEPTESVSFIDPEVPQDPSNITEIVGSIKKKKRKYLGVRQLNKLGITTIRIRSGKVKNQGTYGTEEVCIKFGSWLSTEFEVAVTRSFRKYNSALGDGHRDAACESSKNMNKALDVQFNVGKKFWEYSNEADMINQLVLGYTVKQWKANNPGLSGDKMRQHLTSEQLRNINTLQVFNTALISMGLSREERLWKLVQNNQHIIHEKFLLN